MQHNDMAMPLVIKRFVLQHPHDPRRAIAYGWGPEGYFALLFESGQMKASRKRPNVTRRQARHDLIEWTIELGFFTSSDFDEATTALDTLRVEQLPRRLHTLVDLVMSFTA
jgi:hypothetical protein